MSHVTPEYVHECDMTHSYWVMSHLSMFMCVTWLIHIYECNMTHYGWVMSHLNSWVWHDSFILSHVTPEYVYECDITHYEWVMPYLNNFMSVTWLTMNESCHTWIRSWVWHDSFILSHVTPEYVHEGDMTHSWLIHITRVLVLCGAWCMWGGYD